MKKSVLLVLCLSISLPYVFSQNARTSKANFAGTACRYGVGFSIGNYGYIGMGDSPRVTNNDLWQYDPSNNSWSQKASLAAARTGAVGFSIGMKGYVGTGLNGSTKYNDFWQYSPINNAVNDIDNHVQTSVYPNPFFAESAVFIQSNSAMQMQNLELKIFDLQGKNAGPEVIKKENFFLINRGNLQEGIYFCSLYEKGLFAGSGKLIVQ